MFRKTWPSASWAFHAPPILRREPFSVGDFGQDFNGEVNGEVNVAQPVNVFAQHAAEEDHAVDSAEEPSIPVHLFHAG